MKNKGSTIDNKEKRIIALQDILEKYDLKDYKPKPKEIIGKLAKKGFKITKTTLYSDYTELAINDPFVRDFASKTYSKIVHDCFDSLDYAERKAREILDKKWTRSRATKKEVFVNGNKQTITEKTLTEEIAEPPLKAIELIRSCAETKVKLLSGK